jgi:cold shock CspA family protein
MKGNVSRISAGGYGFIQGEDQTDYFFHKTDYMGDFGMLSEDVMTGRKVTVEFSSVPSHKGPRASNVNLSQG